MNLAFLVVSLPLLTVIVIGRHGTTTEPELNFPNELLDGVNGQNDQPLKLEEARKALVDLARQQPKAFIEPADEIQKTNAVVKGNVTIIGKFRLFLETKSFRYILLSTDTVKEYTTGVFVLQKDGQWTAVIQDVIRGHKVPPKK